MKRVSEIGCIDSTQIVWSLVNDSVMGGLSSSKLARNEDNKHIQFSGHISLSNNGGFAIVNAAVNADYFTGFSQLSVKVRGDGRTYQFRLRPDSNLEDIAFVVEFETKSNIWQTKIFQLSDFIAQHRGHRLNNTKPIDSKQIEQVGFLAGNEVEGTFKLDIGSISGC